jgi:MFS family permease
MSNKTKILDSQENKPDWLQGFMESPEKQQQLYRKSLWIVMISQLFGGAGLAAGITVGALLAQEMLGSNSLAGVPTTLFTIGSAGAALLVGQLSQRYGRRPGIATGFFIGGLGAVGVVISAITQNIILLFVSLFIYGAGGATNLQARYAGTDLANSTQRATAISMAMVATTFGAVAGPNSVNLMGEFAEAFGFPALSGPFMLAATAYILAGLVIYILLRPDPFIVAREITAVKTLRDQALSMKDASSSGINKRGIVAGATVMIVTNFIMIAIMTMTPVHMGHHQHGLKEVGLVIGFHVAAMFLPSLGTGILVDKIGRTAMVLACSFTLFAAGILAAYGPGHSMLSLNLSLILLGLGWNFGLISGTSLIVDSTNASIRAKTQGYVDVIIALSGAAGGALSGIVVGISSFSVLSLGGAILSLLLIPVMIWSRRRKEEKVAI